MNRRMKITKNIILALITAIVLMSCLTVSEPKMTLAEASKQGDLAKVQA